MRIFAYLDVPDEDEAYVEKLWDDGDWVAIREYAESHETFWKIEAK